MAEKIKEKSRIISQEKIAGDVYSMWLDSEQIAENAKPGQFISVFSKDGSRLLPRPISICETDREKNALRIVYRVVGKGTNEFSKLTDGSEIEIMGPLGNGFPLDRNRRRYRNSPYGAAGKRIKRGKTSHCGLPG